MYIREKIANKRKIRRLQQRSNIPRTFVLTHIYHFEFATMSRCREIRPVMSKWTRWRVARTTRTHLLFKVSGGDTFISAFITCYKLTDERDVHLHTAVSFNSISHSLERQCFSRIERRCSMIRVYHALINIRTWCFDLGPSKSISGTHMHESSTHRILQFSSLTIYAVTDCLLPIDNRGHDSATPEILWAHRIVVPMRTTYSSLIFNCFACCITSRSMLSLVD